MTKEIQAVRVVSRLVSRILWASGYCTDRQSEQAAARRLRVSSPSCQAILGSRSCNSVDASSDCVRIPSVVGSAEDGDLGVKWRMPVGSVRVLGAE